MARFEQTADGWEICHRDGDFVGRAQFNADRTRRYVLIRRWAHADGRNVEGVESLTWCMLNPSTAGAAEDDATIRKCMGYARRWGYGGIRVLNLFDLILTDSTQLAHPQVRLTANSPENDATWRFWLEPIHGQVWTSKPDVVVAWGDQGRLLNRDRWAAEQFARVGVEPLCIGTTKAGQPLHPGRTSYDLERVPWGPPQ